MKLSEQYIEKYTRDYIFNVKEDLPDLLEIVRQEAISLNAFDGYDHREAESKLQTLAAKHGLKYE